MKNTTQLRIATLGILMSLGATLGLSACDSTTELELGTVGDTMAFDKTTLEAKAGSTVKLTLKNNGTTAAMQHDWVLTQPGKDQEVDTASMAAGPSKDYIAADNPAIIAHTKLLKPGESETITFKAPSQPGDYPYLCTFPGHYPLMKGTLKVE